MCAFNMIIVIGKKQNHNLSGIISCNKVTEVWNNWFAHKLRREYSVLDSLNNLKFIQICSTSKHTFHTTEEQLAENAGSINNNTNSKFFDKKINFSKSNRTMQPYRPLIYVRICVSWILCKDPACVQVHVTQKDTTPSWLVFSSVGAYGLKKQLVKLIRKITKNGFWKIQSKEYKNRIFEGFYE